MILSTGGWRARAALVAVLGLLWAGGRVAALPLPEGRPALRFYSAEQGLPQSVVLSLALDAQGYLWLGTQDGVARFDGRALTPVSIPSRGESNSVRAILGAADGSVWFGTNAGLLRRLGDRWERYQHLGSGLPDDRILSLLETRDAAGPALWVGTEGGLARFAAGAWKVWTSHNSALPSDRVSSLLATVEDGHPVLWAGTAAGLARWTGGVWTAVAGPPAGAVSCLLTTRGAAGPVLWAGTDRGGLGRFDGRKWTTWSPANSGLPSVRILSLAATGEAGGGQTLWVGTDRGLARLRGSEWTVFDHGGSVLPADQVISLLAMNNGGTPLLWIGMRDGGAAMLSPSGWSTFDPRNSGLSFPSVYSLAETGPAGNPVLWLGTEAGGLARWEAGRWTRLHTGNSPLPSDTVNAVASTGVPGSPSGETVWIGTADGLARLAAGRWTVFTPRDSPLPHEEILTLLVTEEAGGPALWIGTRRGLARYTAAGWTVWTSATSGLPDDEVYALAQTAGPRGPVLWVGTRNRGLARLEDGRWTSFDRRNTPLPNSWVNCLRVVRQGGQLALWVGTDGGAARLDLSGPQPRWIVLTEATEPKLANNMVLHMEEDGRGRVYLLTNRGIVRVSLLQPQPRAAADLSLSTFKVGDGLPSNEGNSGASMVDRRGHLWFGTVGGAAVLDPEAAAAPAAMTAMAAMAAPVPLRIERISLDGRPVSPAAAGLRLGRRVREVRFEFSLLRFVRGEEPTYRVQLAGLDPRPSPWMTDPYRTYGALPAGDYVFRVWGRDAAGTVSAPAEVPLVVLPAPWQTLPAYAAYAALGLLAVTGIWRLSSRSQRRRHERLKEEVRERTAELAHTVAELQRSESQARAAQEAAERANQAKGEFLANMSHEIRTPMNAVLGMATVLQGTPLTLEQHDHVETIRSSGESLLSLLNEVLDFSKIDAGMIEVESRPCALLPRLEEAVELVAESAARKGLEIGCLVADGVPEGVRTDATRMRQILVNLLSNAVKFTSRGEVFLSVEMAGEGEMELAVRDTGIGIPADRLDRLFRPFSQADSSTTRLYGGTGLGLTISRRLTEILGGRIWVESEAGNGSVFRFTLPCRPCPAEDLPPAAYLSPRPALLDGRRLLLFTESAQVVRILSWYARRWGLEVTEMSQGGELPAEGPPFDLAVVDLAAGDGGEAARRCAAAGLPWISLLPMGTTLEPPGGAAASLGRPIRGSRFHVGVLKALGLWQASSPGVDVGAAASLLPGPDSALRILVVEDNPINQKVVQLLLKRLGYRAEMVANGLEALAALRRQPYDLVFMDIQMPGMDGMETTRRIRAGLPAGAGPTIVAMTAHAWREAREACLASGMDDFLSKPLVLEDLAHVLHRAAGLKSAAGPSSLTPASLIEAGLAFDLQPLQSLRKLEELAGRSAVDELVERFLDEARQRLDRMRRAVGAADPAELCAVAHSLRGSSAQLGARGLAKLSEVLEELGRRGSCEGAADLLDQLAGELARLEPAMRAKVAQAG